MVGLLLSIAILSVFGSILTLLDKLGTSQPLTGFATFDTGVVNVTIQATVDINLIVDNVDFGTGTVNAGGLNTSLNTSDTAWGGNGNPNGFSNAVPVFDYIKSINLCSAFCWIQYCCQHRNCCCFSCSIRA